MGRYLKYKEVPPHLQGCVCMIQPSLEMLPTKQENKTMRGCEYWESYGGNSQKVAICKAEVVVPSAAESRRWTPVWGRMSGCACLLHLKSNPKTSISVSPFSYLPSLHFTTSSHLHSFWFHLRPLTPLLNLETVFLSLSATLLAV